MKRLPMRRALLVLIACPLLAAAATTREPASGAKLEQAGAYTVDWSTVDGGGDRSSGGAYVLTGTVGQADADPLQPSEGGVYQLDGGWWGGAGPVDELFRDSFE